MFRTSYVPLQQDYIVHAALYGMFSTHLCKQSIRLKDVLEESNGNTRLHKKLRYIVGSTCIVH
jgi:hypothetical protein